MLGRRLAVYPRHVVHLHEHADHARPLAAAYEAQGFEIGLHVNTGVRRLHAAATIADFYASAARRSSRAKYTSDSRAGTNRTHCIVWSDCATQPRSSLANGIRLDTNYYYWPGTG